MAQRAVASQEECGGTQAEHMALLSASREQACGVAFFEACLGWGSRCLFSTPSHPTVLAQLLPLLHGNVNGSKVIIREFQERCRRGLLSPPSPTPHPHVPNSEDAVVVPSKARLKRLISENSAYEKRPDFRMCWYVHPQVLRSFGQECLPVPCQWTYVTAMPSTPREDTGNTSEGPDQGTPMPIKRKPAATMCITQFMKKRRYDGQVSCRGHGPCSPVPIADCAPAHSLCQVRGPLCGTGSLPPSHGILGWNSS